MINFKIDEKSTDRKSQDIDLKVWLELDCMDNLDLVASKLDGSHKTYLLSITRSGQYGLQSDVNPTLGFQLDEGGYLTIDRRSLPHL